MEQFGQDKLNDVGLQVDHEVRQQLTESSKWARFIAITVFSFCGLMVLVGVAASSVFMNAFSRVSSLGSLGGASAAVLSVVIVIVVAIVAVVYYFLYNFAVKVKAAMLSEDNEKFNAGISSLKIFFIITTIGGIISLLASLYNIFNLQF